MISTRILYWQFPSRQVTQRERPSPSAPTNWCAGRLLWQREQHCISSDSGSPSSMVDLCTRRPPSSYSRPSAAGRNLFSRSLDKFERKLSISWHGDGYAPRTGRRERCYYSKTYPAWCTLTDTTPLALAATATHTTPDIWTWVKLESIIKNK